MKRMVRISSLLALLCLSSGLSVLWAQPGKPPNTPVFTGMPERPIKNDNLRALRGQVMGPGERPLEKAVVYLKNLHDLKITTFITGKDGVYRFNSLSANLDYQVRAEYQGATSKVRTLSSMDGKKEAVLNLKMEDKKPSAATGSTTAAPAATGKTNPKSKPPT